MGFTRERTGGDGKVRYTAVYRDLKGRLRSAGTFTQRREADRAWQRAEAKVAQGYLGDPGPRPPDVPRLRGEHLAAEPRDRGEHPPVVHLRAAMHGSCTSSGSMRMIDILPEHVREWIAGMKRGGVTPPTIRYA